MSTSGSTTQPAPIAHALPAMIPDGICADLVRLAVDDDRVPGVRAALVAADEVGVLGEQVDDLALALVAPLRADDHGRGHVPQCRTRARRAGGEVAPTPPRGRRTSRTASGTELDRVGRAVAVLGEDDLGDPLLLGLLAVVVLVAVDEEDEVRVLFDAVVNTNIIGNEVVEPFDGQVVDLLLPVGLDATTSSQ